MAQALRPLGGAYGTIVARRLRRTGYRSRLPVVCIGNFTVGGAGKTPMALWVAEELKRLGRKPVFLSRGYGGSIRGPHLVDSASDRAQQVGDEPLLLARVAPTVIARDRAAGARLIETLDADVIVMDDGLQNPSLKKNLAIAVIDAGVGLGNGLVLPAGPLRAPLAWQLPLVQAIVEIGDGHSDQAALEGWHGLRCQAQMSPIGETSWLRDRPVIAFAGIGRPEKLFETLRGLGADVVAAHGFPDHHPFTPADAERLMAEAAQRAARLVTTEKDHARLTSNPTLCALARAAHALAIGLVFSEMDRRYLVELLDRLPPAQAR